MDQNTITLIQPDDMHIHVRQGENLAGYVGDLEEHFARAIIMPNLLPPVVTADDVDNYRQEILAVAKREFTPLMTFKVMENSKPADLYKAGCTAGKYYPKGVTTNSEDGNSSVDALFPVFEQMQANGLVLCIHGEEPGSFILDREKDFLTSLARIIENFPALRIVLEHVSTKDAVDFVKNGPDTLAATITPQHLLMTLDDVIGGNLQPHHFCKPVLKRPEDRTAIQDVVLSGNKKFFFGSDSAPHLKGAKECDCGCAGVYSAPVNMSLLIDFFFANNKIELLQGFTSEYGADFYELPRNTKLVTYIKKPWTVPGEYHGVVPLMAGQDLNWQLS